MITGTQSKATDFLICLHLTARDLHCVEMVFKV